MNKFKLTKCVIKSDDNIQQTPVVALNMYKQYTTFLFKVRFALFLSDIFTFKHIEIILFFKKKYFLHLIWI